MTNSISTPGIAFGELLAWTAAENDAWHRWCSAHADALETAFGAAPLATVRDVIQHVAFVEHRYTVILAGGAMPATAPRLTPGVDPLFTYVAECRAGFARAVEEATSAGLDRVLDFTTLTRGPQRATARKVVSHALLHGIRHWAQLATVLRERGHATDWSHDLLLSAAMA